MWLPGALERKCCLGRWMARPQREWDPSEWTGSHTPWGVTWSLLSPGPPRPCWSAAKGPFLPGSSMWLAGQQLCSGCVVGCLWLVPGPVFPCGCSRHRRAHVVLVGIHSAIVVLTVCSRDPAGDPQVKTAFTPARMCVSGVCCRWRQDTVFLYLTRFLVLSSDAEDG